VVLPAQALAINFTKYVIRQKGFSRKNTIRLWIEATGSCKWQVAKPVMAERIDAGQKDLKIEGSQAVWNKAT
jgi:hypothetical protein